MLLLHSKTSKGFPMSLGTKTVIWLHIASLTSSLSPFHSDPASEASLLFFKYAKPSPDFCTYCSYCLKNSSFRYQHDLLLHLLQLLPQKVSTGKSFTRLLYLQFKPQHRPVKVHTFFTFFSL